ncbi:MAG: cytochrome c oxidase subunit II [Actinomycetota bacterium]
MRPRTPDRRSRGRARFRRAWLPGLPLFLLLAACTKEYPQNSLAPAGPVAREQADLFFLVFWIAVGVFVVVEGLLVFAMIRFRHRSDDDTPVQVHGNTRLEVAWTIIPALLLAGVAVPTIASIFSLAREPADVAVEINVTGHQFWWEVEYPEQEGISQPFFTANELHIPVGRYVRLNLTSAEAVPPGPVIHSFWVPRLAGKQDVVPGRLNELYIQADDPGTYSGQCAEYCGLSHYLMRFLVVAQPEDQFRAWVEEQQAPAAEPGEGSEAAEGFAVFNEPLPQGPPPGAAEAACVACHTTDPAAGGTVGPNLAHFGSRQTVAAAILPNDPQGVTTWLHDPPGVKPGSRMPNYRLTDDQLDALIAYLESLE